MNVNAQTERGPEDALSLMHAEVTWMFGVDALDNGLRYQLDRKDDATLALWASVGLETCTLASVLQVDPARAYEQNVVPDVEKLINFGGKTARIGDLTDAAVELHPDAPYPPDSRSYVNEIRNKFLHRGTAVGQSGLVGRTLRLIRDLAEWMSAVQLPDVELRKLWVVQATRLPEAPYALIETVERVARDNAEHVQWSLEQGLWDDTPELKPIAEREPAECLAIYE